MDTEFCMKNLHEETKHKLKDRYMKLSPQKIVKIAA